MSRCKIGLTKCKYNDMCFKPCTTCVKHQLEEELRSIELKAYQQGRVNGIEEFVAFINTMPTVEEDDGYIRPMTVEEMAEQLKEKKE